METVEGILEIRKDMDKTTIVLNGNTGNITLGGSGFDGDLIVNNADGEISIGLNGNSGHIVLGNDGKDGGVFVTNNAGNRVVLIEGGGSELDPENPGYDPPGGSIKLLNFENTPTVDLDGGWGNLRLAGRLELDRDAYIGRNAYIGLGRGGPNVILNGARGDIILNNADCAEEFDIDRSVLANPGAVMIMGLDTNLRPCNKAYDKRVTGVISGAGNYKPGIILDRKEGAKNRMPVALLGKVYCQVDADYAPIKTGDLLTTSETEGHAMKVLDPLKGFGAVIGKALASAERGCSLIPILVTLQ